MIVNCTNCDNELGKVFVFFDRHTHLCLDCGEARTSAIERHPSNPTNQRRKKRTS